MDERFCARLALPAKHPRYVSPAGLNGRKLLPSAQALWNEQRILDRMLYKTCNQMRQTPVFRALLLVTRLLRRLYDVESQLSARNAASGVPTTSAATNPAVLVACGRELVERIIHASQRAVSIVDEDMRNVYFVPFSVTSIALLSRVSLLAGVIEQELQVLSVESWVAI